MTGARKVAHATGAGLPYSHQIGRTLILIGEQNGSGVHLKLHDSRPADQPLLQEWHGVDLAATAQLFEDVSTVLNDRQRYEFRDLLCRVRDDVAPAAGDSEAATLTLPHAIRAIDAPPAVPVQWRVPGLIPTGEFGLFGSDGGVGKTTTCLAILGAAAGGYAFAGYAPFTTISGPVLMVSEEDPSAVLLNRLEALIAGHGWDRARVLGNVHILALSGAKLTDLAWQKHLVTEVERIGANLLVLDPLFELSDAKENSNTEQRPSIQFCRMIGQRTGASVIVVLHYGKASEGKRKIDRLRGASAWFNAARFAYALELHEDGLSVECLKLSRAERPRPFVLERQVITDPAHDGIWVSATLRYRMPQDVDLDLVEQWVVQRLEEADGRLTTTDLKKLGLGSRIDGKGISGEGISKALPSLQKAGRIDFVPGPKGAKRWGLSSLPGNLGKVIESTLPTLPDACQAMSEDPARTLPSPLGEKGKVAVQRAPASWPPPKGAP